MKDALDVSQTQKNRSELNVQRKSVSFLIEKRTLGSIIKKTLGSFAHFLY